MQAKVIALVVSYNGGEELSKTVCALVDQVQKIIVLDNHSNEENQELITELSHAQDIFLVRFDSNIGIGAALNKGVEIAKREGFEWILTMDQDSIAAPNMISEMLVSAENASGVNVICPSLAFSDVEFVETSDKSVNYAITSGNLIPMYVFARNDGYNEGYFIDSVDFEFSLRLKNNGVGIIRSGRAKLLHRLGEVTWTRLFFVNYRYTKHSPLRRYYMTRNHFRLVFDFWKKNPIFLLKKSLVLGYQMIEIMLFDDRPRENFKMMYLGLRDCLQGRGGRFEGS